MDLTCHHPDAPPLTAASTTVVVGTFGGPEWRDLAQNRATPSARALGVQVVHIHSDTLWHARNLGLAEVDTPWVIFLDADDELEPGYVEAMGTGTADVRAPSVRYVHPGRRWPQPITVPVAGHRHACTADCLVDGNWLVVGSPVLTELCRGVGGFRDFAWSEDWDVWLRCHLAGATFEHIPAAVYRAYIRPDSRNRSLRQVERLAVHRAIAVANGIPSP